MFLNQPLVLPLRSRHTASPPLYHAAPCDQPVTAITTCGLRSVGSVSQMLPAKSKDAGTPLASRHPLPISPHACLALCRKGNVLSVRGSSARERLYQVEFLLVGGRMQTPSSGLGSAAWRCCPCHPPTGRPGVHTAPAPARCGLVQLPQQS